MVNATLQATPPVEKQTPSVKLVPVSSVGGKDHTTPSEKNQSGKTQRTFRSKPSKNILKPMLTAIVLFIIIFGGGVGLLLTQRNQDVRQQAASSSCMGVPLAREPAVTLLPTNQIKLQWNTVVGAKGYRLFLITEGQAGSHPSGKYIIYNILDETSDVGQTAQFQPIVASDAKFLNPEDSSYIWTIPTDDRTDLEGLVIKNRPYYRFLVFAFRDDQCSTQAAIGSYISSQGSAGTCSCDLSVVMENNCAQGFVPQCVSQVACECGAPSTTGAPPPGTDPSCTNITVEGLESKWIENNSRIELRWQKTNSEIREYEIWNIGYGSLQQLGEKQYYLRKINDFPIVSTATSFIVSNPEELSTRRYLLRAVAAKNQNGEPICYNQWATCVPPVVSNQKAVKVVNYTYTLSWTPIQKPDKKYEIWLIAEGDLETLGEEKYYLAKLGEADPSINAVPVTIPQEFRQLPNYRFLLRAVNYLENEQPTCYNQWAFSASATGGLSYEQCSMSFDITEPISVATPTPTTRIIAPSATPTTTPSLTPTRASTPTVTPKPPIGCNDICSTNADCSNSAHICFVVSETESRCRLESNPTDSSCSQAVVQQQQPPTAIPTQPLQVEETIVAQPDLPEQLPESGPEDWGMWLKAGLTIIGIGAALLLLL